MNDPLNEDLMSLETSMPLLESPNNYDLKVEKVEVKASGKGAAMLHLELSTTAPANSMPDHTGKVSTLQPGVRVFDNIMLEATGKATMDMVKRSVAALLQAAVIPGLGSIAAVRSTPNLLQGAVLRCKVGYEKDGTGTNGKAYPAKNVIMTYLKK